MSRSVAAEAVVAHEIGHAQQDAQSYPAMQLRASLVPAGTTPVEMNVSHRALALLADNGVIFSEEREGARRMLRAAAFTYWVALIASVLTLLYYASLVFGRRDD